MKYKNKVLSCTCHAFDEYSSGVCQPQCKG